MTEKKVFEPTPELASKAKTYRIIALVLWAVAIGLEVFAILKLLKNDMLTWLIVVIVAILAMSITGSLLWKKANRFDPASKKEKFKFFVQNQLGAIIAVLAFLPLVLFILLNKDMDKKSKGIAGAVAGVALIIAAAVGIDFNPPSVEEYTEQINSQTETLKKINLDNDLVYWTQHGTKYHIYDDCYHIKHRESISNGTVKESWEAKGISELCKTCEKKAIKENEVDLEGLTDLIPTGDSEETAEVEEIVE